MIAKINEHSGCFEIALEAENMQDAAVITRMGMNAKKKLQGSYSYADENGSFSASVVIAKHRRANSEIVRRK